MFFNVLVQIWKKSQVVYKIGLILRKKNSNIYEKKKNHTTRNIHENNLGKKVMLDSYYIFIKICAGIILGKILKIILKVFFTDHKN